MSNSKVYREIVQAGLDSRAAERVEANLEKQARLLRLIINDNHTTKTTPKASERPQNKDKPKEVAQVQAEAVPMTGREQEAEECRAWYKFMALVFAPLILASLLVSLAGTAPIAIPLLILMAAYTGLILLTSIIVFFPKPARAEIKQCIRSFKKTTHR